MQFWHAYFNVFTQSPNKFQNFLISQINSLKMIFWTRKKISVAPAKFFVAQSPNELVKLFIFIRKNCWNCSFLCTSRIQFWHLCRKFLAQTAKKKLSSFQTFFFQNEPLDSYLECSFDNLADNSLKVQFFSVQTLKIFTYLFFCIFSQIRSSEHVECSFGKPAITSLKIKKNIINFYSFFAKCFCGHVDCSFDSAAEHLLLRIWKLFAQSPKNCLKVLEFFR